MGIQFVNLSWAVKTITHFLVTIQILIVSIKQQFNLHTVVVLRPDRIPRTILVNSKSKYNIANEVHILNQSVHGSFMNKYESRC